MTKQPPRSRTINPTTILVAIVAFYCGLATRRLPWWMAAGPAALACGAISWFLVARALVAISFGVRCPACGQSTMERRAVVGFGNRFYACSACGSRRRRMVLGPWEDASGPEFDPFYAASRAEDPWSQPPDLEDGHAVYSKTHANLVRSKRRRNPDEPNGPGLPS